MKKSLELLEVTSSGLEFVISGSVKSDDEVYNEAVKLTDLLERENYLRSSLEKKPGGYTKSKRLLAELIKSTDPKYACDLVFSICVNSPVAPKNYILFAEIAVENNAWLVAKSAIEVSKWLCEPTEKEIIKEIKSLYELINQKLSNQEQDNSKDEFWQNKVVDKYWILRSLFYHAKKKKVVEYSFKLLNVFPNDRSNYEVVYKALSLVNEQEVLNAFIKYIEKNLNNDKISQNLYLGMVYYSLSDFASSNSYLNEVLKIEKVNPKALFYLSLNHLFNNNTKDFVAAYEKIVPLPEPSFAALYFIYCAILNFKLDEIEFPDQKNISREISEVLNKLLNRGLYELSDFLIRQFKMLNYHLILPFLNLYLAELFIKRKGLESAKELLDTSTDNEVHRLNAWIYRLEGKEDLAEKELVEYRKNWIPDKKAGILCQLVDLNLPEETPNEIEKIFEIVKNAYHHTKNLIAEFDLEYGLNAMTCIETTCQDCCKKTFPYISYIEYMYLKSWLDNQPEELRKKIYERSKEVVEVYKKRFGKEPPFITRKRANLDKDYPPDFVFECPNLGDNKCNVYEARPFTCRAYGYASADGVRYKGCNYFFEQLKGASRLNDVRKVISMESFFNFTKHIDEMLIGNSVIAPIPVWFAQNHEETMEKLNKVLDSCEQSLQS